MRKEKYKLYPVKMPVKGAAHQANRELIQKLEADALRDMQEDFKSFLEAGKPVL